MINGSLEVLWLAPDSDPRPKMFLDNTKSGTITQVGVGQPTTITTSFAMRVENSGTILHREGELSFKSGEQELDAWQWTEYSLKNLPGGIVRTSENSRGTPIGGMDTSITWLGYGFENKGTFYIMEPWRVNTESTMKYTCDIYGRILNDNGQVIFSDYGMGKVAQHVAGNVPAQTDVIIFKNNSTYDVTLNFDHGGNVDKWSCDVFTLLDNNTWILHTLHQPQPVPTLQLIAIFAVIENDFTTFQFDDPVQHALTEIAYVVLTP
jgi:hypothetical protein